jgi:putative FmdB family regulatory protein
MPTYEYECSACGHRFDAFQKISDAPLSKCPKCGKKVKRLISAGLGIIFKGSGFYTTDYKKSSSVTSAAAPKKETAKPKTEQKSEQKSEKSGGQKDKTASKIKNSA